MDQNILRHTLRIARTLRPTKPYRSPQTSTYNHAPRHLRFRSTDTGNNQAYPLTGYYADILSTNQKSNQHSTLLSTPTQKVQPATHTAPTPPPPESLPKTQKEETLQKARVVFGSRLAGPTERRDEIDKASKEVAGILVPPKPAEPDNCCMSGCVNCVWDVYREDFEEWAAKSQEAKAKMKAQKMEKSEDGSPAHVASSMDDDGGGSEALWDAASEGAGEKLDPYENLPVEIREFMRVEKMLKEKHAREGTKG